MHVIEEIKDLEDLVGQELDFYLEDDMFELEGIVRKDDNKFLMEITGGIPHILKMIGKFVEIKLSNQKIYLQRLDTKKEFEIFINRIYNTLNNPTKEEFCTILAKGICEVFRKSDNTLVSYINNSDKWSIKFFRNDQQNSISKIYETLEALYDDNSNIMHGKWDFTYYNCEW